MREIPPRLEPERILRALIEHDVDFVIIGGIAAQAWGSPSLTADLDICYERTPENMRRMAQALASLNPRLRGPNVPPDLPFTLDERAIELGDHFTLRTDAGDLDLLGTPAGTRGYSDLTGEAVEVDLFRVTVRVVSLDDLIRMKRAAGRAKDRAEIEYLGPLRDELERRGALDAPAAQKIVTQRAKRAPNDSDRPKPPRRSRSR